MHAYVCLSACRDQAERLFAPKSVMVQAKAAAAKVQYEAAGGAGGGGGDGDEKGGGGGGANGSGNGGGNEEGGGGGAEGEVADKVAEAIAALTKAPTFLLSWNWKRLSWTWRHVLRVLFLSNAIFSFPLLVTVSSSLPAVRAFALFGSLMMLVMFLVIMTVFPTVIMFYQRYLQSTKVYGVQKCNRLCKKFIDPTTNESWDSRLSRLENFFHASVFRVIVNNAPIAVFIVAVLVAVFGYFISTIQNDTRSLNNSILVATHPINLYQEFHSYFRDGGNIKVKQRERDRETEECSVWWDLLRVLCGCALYFRARAGATTIHNNNNNINIHTHTRRLTLFLVWTSITPWTVPWRTCWTRSRLGARSLRRTRPSSAPSLAWTSTGTARASSRSATGSPAQTYVVFELAGRRKWPAGRQAGRIGRQAGRRTVMQAGRQGSRRGPLQS